ncbi:MAG: hypothetical protein Q7J25_12395, partial [Vicinamibacterales bacterium]|nr:hypothetical protein [Vicinamibacterales bacterium]
MAGDALVDGPMRFDIVTIFPAMVAGGLTEGVVARGIGRGAVDVRIWDLRDQATDRHRSVDDMPYGGGPGMVMTPQPWVRRRHHPGRSGVDGQTHVRGGRGLCARRLRP